MMAVVKKITKKAKEYYAKMDKKHKFSSDSEDSKLDELYELDNNIEMNKTMQQDSLEELRIAKTSNPKKKKENNDLVTRTCHALVIVHLEIGIV